MSLKTLLAALILFGLVACQSAQAQLFSTESLTDAQFAQYEEQLNAILLTRFDHEKEFVEEMVDQVQAGNLPPRMVSTSFQWVRTRRPGTRYPFVYFQQVMTMQANRLGIDQFVPEFDFGRYSSGLGQ